MLMAVLGWSIPQLRANPMLQMDEERGFGQNVITVILLHYKVHSCMYIKPFLLPAQSI